MTKTPLTLLFIDDDPAEIALVARLLAGLEEWDVECLEAWDLPSARPALARKDLDLILLDDHLGGSSGLDLLQRLREEGEAHPIVLVTAYGDEEVVAEALRRGADDYLSKQRLDPPSLRRAITGALDRRRRREERALLEQSLVENQAQEITRLARLYAALAHVNQAILQAASRQALFDRACEGLAEFGGFSLVCIRWSETDAPPLRLTSLYGAGKGLESREDRTRRTCRTGEETVLRDGRTRIFRSHPEADAPCPCEGALEGGFASAAMAVLRSGGRCCGILTVLSREEDYFGIHEIALIEEVARDISFALEHLDLRARQARDEAALKESEERFQALFERSRDAIFWADAENGTLIRCNSAAERLMGRSAVEIVGQPLSFLHPPQEAGSYREMFHSHAQQEPTLATEGEILRQDGRRVPVEILPTVIEQNGRKLLQGIFRDISDRRLQEEERALTERLVRDLDAPGDIHACLSRLTASLQRWSGCEAVGVRLREGEDFPYYETHGFPSDFVQMENHLCLRGPNNELLRDGDGNPVLECMCGNVLCGRIDPTRSFFTDHGSFWANNTSRLLATTTEADRQSRTRNRCNGEGYESVALIPLRAGHQVFGLLQFNDTRTDRFTRDRITHFERTADAIALALSRRQAEEERLRITALYATLSEANQAIVRATDAVTLFQDICCVCIDQAHYDLAWIGWPDADTSRLEVAACAGPLAAYLDGIQINLGPDAPEGEDPSGRCFTENREEVCQDWTLDSRLQPLKERAERFGIRSSAAIPLCFEGRVAAVLNLYSKEPEAFRSDRLALLREMGGDLAFALEGFAQEERHRRAEEAFRSTFEQAAVGFTHVSPEGKFLKVNHRFAEMMGYAEEELLGRSYIEFTHPDDLEADTREIRAIAGGDVPNRSREKRYLRKDGTPFWIRLTPSLVRHPDGTPDYFVNVIEDLTESKREEEARHQLESQLHQMLKMESLGTLTAGIAHDMNNILAAIMGTAEVAQSICQPGGGISKSIDLILRASQRGRDLVKGLSNFARKGLEEPTWVNLNDIAQSEIDLLRRTTLRKVEVRAELDTELPSILGEPSALSNALMNLCVNAVDAMPEGGTLTIGTRACPGGGVDLTVSDTGQGMTPEVLAKATDPFFTTKPVGKGTGLGLAIVFGILKAHGGTVDLRSSPGEGATAILHLPPATKRPEPMLHEPVACTPGRACLNILLVDDDELILATIPQMLAALGHRVETARDGQEALDCLARGLMVDMVILDHNMPGLRGSDTLARLREGWPRLPVLFVTGYLDAAVEIEVSRHALVQVLRKPYTLVEIQEAIECIMPPGDRSRSPSKY